LHRRKKPGVKEPLPKHAKVSPATVPLTPDAPIPSPIRDDIHMEETGDQFGLIPETNPTTEATAKDVVQGGKASGSSHGQRWTYLREVLVAACIGRSNKTKLFS
jgi:hypothetical protein